MMLLLLACTPSPFELSADELALAQASAVEAPAPDPTNHYAEDPAAAALGQALFYDERLSGPGTVSCATCHDPEHGFADTERLSEGVSTTLRHAPTALNAAMQRWLFWDGRADSLWSQALGPLESPAEHGGSRLQYAHLLAEDPELSAAYESLFGPLPDLSDNARFPPEGRPVPDDPEHPHALAWASLSAEDQDLITEVYVHIGKSIAAYEALLLSRSSPFDRALDALAQGEPSPLTEQEQQGMKLFFGEARCVKCHNGPAFSDLDFHNVALGERDWLAPQDRGRAAGIERLLASEFHAASVWSDDPQGPRAQELAALTAGTAQEGAMKTAGLRDVALSAPYMHGGHYNNLEEVVYHYVLLDSEATVGTRDELLQPLDLDYEQVLSIVAFLETLSGDPLDAALLGP